MLRVVASRSPDLEALMANGRHWTNVLRNEGLVTPGLRILDVGAGLGRLAIPLQAMGCTVHAVDARADMVEHLEAAGVEAMHYDGVPDALGTDSYDLVLAMHVFQHQGRHHVEALLKSMHRVAPRLLFTLPTAEAYAHRLPADYVLGHGTTERFVNCERSFTYLEAEVPQLLHGCGYASCVRVGRNKLWHAQR
jgi:SAM-dependent methyltransferase